MTDEAEAIAQKLFPTMQEPGNNPQPPQNTGGEATEEDKASLLFPSMKAEQDNQTEKPSKEQTQTEQPKEQPKSEISPLLKKHGLADNEVTGEFSGVLKELGINNQGADKLLQTFTTALD